MSAVALAVDNVCSSAWDLVARTSDSLRPAEISLANWMSTSVSYHHRWLFRTPEWADDHMLLAESGWNGFLGTRGSFMLDFVFLAMFAVIPVMGWSIYMVKYRQNYVLHKWVQLTLAVVLLLSVAAFEVDMRLSPIKWTERAKPSPYFTPDVWCSAKYALVIHLMFAIPTPFLWVYTIVTAFRNFPSPPAPSEYSAKHIKTARLAALGMFFTATTGWCFYWMAFVAT
jgi:uncharacterized membrane protein YozB (DUF420 family)